MTEPTTGTVTPINVEATKAIKAAKRFLDEGKVTEAIALLSATVKPAELEVEWRSAQEVFAKLPPAQWVSEELQLGPGRPNQLWGYGASGKTIAAQSMALSVATGHDIWGRFACKSGKVVHVDLEQGFRATARRYQRLALGLDIEPPEIEDNLLVACLPSLYLNESKALDEYARVADGSKLVIIDSLRAATAGIDENDSRIRLCLDELTRVSEKTGAAFLVLHHSGKPKEGHSDQRTVGRGSSAIFDAGGSIFVMSGSKSAPKAVSHQKTPADAEGAALDDFSLAIEDVRHGLNATAGVRVVVKAQPAAIAPSPNPKGEAIRLKILAYVTKNPGASKRSIRGEIGGCHDAVDNQLDWLVSNGRLVKPDRNSGYTMSG